MMDDCVDLAVCGPWHKTKRQELRNDLYYYWTEWVGNLTWHDLPVFLNNSKAAMYLGVSKAYRLNWQTNKPFEAISSHAMLFFDEGIEYLRDWFGDWFCNY